MRVIIFGANGLLGGYLQRAFSAHEVFAWDQETLDITDRNAILAQCETIAPDVMINAAAYNAVDEIEQNPEASRRAFLINAHSVQRLAEAAKKQNACFVHFSSDYVFDGKKGEPYIEDDDPFPQSAYARSKREGEEILLRLGLQDLSWYLVRTSRLYGSAKSENGKETFPDLVLRLAQNRSSLEFVDGVEIASPTYAKDLADAVLEIVESKKPSGIYHRTNDGGCSWYEFAQAVLQHSEKFTIEETDKKKKFVQILPVAASEVPRPAPRPKFSVLATTKLPPLRSWKEALVAYLSEQVEDIPGK